MAVKTVPMKRARVARAGPRSAPAAIGRLILAEDKERRALARDLHDDLGQILPIVKIRLTSLYASQDVAKLHAGLREIEKLIDAANRSLRSLAMQLSPPVLLEHGLVQALEWLAAEMERSCGLSVELRDDGKPKPLDDKQGITLFRAARELLANVAAHAGVERAVLSTRLDGGRLCLAVSDAGTGLVPPGPGLGLAGVRERMDLIGGELAIDSRPGAGTTVTLSAPLEPPGD